MNPLPHRPRKRYGQHFLHDVGVIERIMRAVAPRPEERLIEIGPGLGALTQPLLARLGHLDVVEIDRDVIPMLQQRCLDDGELRVHQMDILKFDFVQYQAGGPPLRVVGNLPYNISTPLLFHLLKQATAIRDMHFMLQKEVAYRLAAVQGNEHYGRLSVMVQWRCKVELLFTVGSGAFTPAPKVDSALVRLIPHTLPPVQVNDARVFSELVNRVFSLRRKTVRNSLRGMLDAADIAALGIEPGLRPEVLSLAEFATLANTAADKRKG